MKFSEAILEFKSWKSFKLKENTIKGVEYNLRCFCLYLRDPDLEKVGWAEIKEYIDGMVALGWDSNTFVQKLNSFKKFFEYWHKRDAKYLDPDWIPQTRKNIKPPRIIDEESYIKLLASIPLKTEGDASHLRNLAYINLLWDTGARRGEILALNLTDLDLDKKKAVIRTEKAKWVRPFREIFWTDTTNENLKKWIERRNQWKARGRIKDPQALFIATKGMHTGNRMGPCAASHMLKEYCLKADMPVFNPHSFRHHMGHDIISKGGSNADVAGILGHSSLESTFIYTMIRDKELEGRYRKFKGD